MDNQDCWDFVCLGCGLVVWYLLLSYAICLHLCIICSGFNEENLGMMSFLSVLLYMYVKMSDFIFLYSLIQFW